MARRRRKPRRESGGPGACPRFLTFWDRFRRNHEEKDFSPPIVSRVVRDITRGVALGGALCCLTCV